MEKKWGQAPFLKVGPGPIFVHFCKREDNLTLWIEQHKKGSALFFPDAGMLPTDSAHK
ncbi:MAG: hypothetical protein GTO16_10210 [Candidatus Aminicenantes bacterium]|nr:hypothetical protein [Candidatus Aminicenantes bacterium]